MSKKILWLDDNPDESAACVRRLLDDGFNVRCAITAKEAEDIIKEENFDLVIVDAMIPTYSEEEEKGYSPTITDVGRSTGLVFYRRMREFFINKRTKVLALTIRLDPVIKRDFVDAGLPPEQFIRKRGYLDDVEAFSQLVTKLLPEEKKDNE